MTDTDKVPAVLALAAHPDDIEFMMAGTLFLLKQAGWDVHYMNIANGNCGSATDDSEMVIARRRHEAIEACEILGAHFYDSLCNDLDILYTPELIGKVTSVVRRVRPRIVLLQSPSDYMEDHMISARIGVTAVFARGMRNYPGIPPLPPIGDEVVVYHALPYGLRTPLRKVIRPGLYVDIASVLEKKRAMLAAHRSQKEWLDVSQGQDSYLHTMETFARQVGHMSGVFQYAEGWRRRLHLGFSEREDDDPLREVLGAACRIDETYEADLGTLEE